MKNPPIRIPASFQPAAYNTMSILIKALGSFNVRKPSAQI